MYAEKFNRDLSAWSVGAVTDMGYSECVLLLFQHPVYPLSLVVVSHLLSPSALINFYTPIISVCMGKGIRPGPPLRSSVGRQHGGSNQHVRPRQARQLHRGDGLLSRPRDGMGRGLGRLHAVPCGGVQRRGR